MPPFHTTYDQVGRLYNSYTGTEARAHTGRPGGQWGIHDGPYSQAYLKDVWGNVTQKMGRAGDPDQFTATYTNNRRDGFSYDASGDLTFDGGQNFSYDATGQQVYVDWPNLRQWYDGDRLRVKKTEGGANTPTYYLRSSVLDGQVVAELGAGGGWQRGYVYGAGGEQLATQTAAGVEWTYQDPATKSQRQVNSSGAVTSVVDLDPWGRETARSDDPPTHPRRYTTYERDSNGSDEAMYRRYNRWHMRFDQPDPYDGSYDLADPQSFNRYAYTNNDPVNATDPTGLRCYTIFKVFFYSDNGEEIARFPVGGFCDDWDGFGGGGQGRDVKEPNESEFPCPPTGKELAKNPKVQAALDSAMTDSQRGTSKVHEEGGWIYMDRDGGLHIERAGPERVNGRREIDLNNPPIYADKILVADFHTHPYVKGELEPDRPVKITADQTKPSTGRNSDTSNTKLGGVPGLVKSPQMIRPYGPNRRGSDPKKAGKRTDAYGAYPGNTSDTRKRCK